MLLLTSVYPAVSGDKTVQRNIAHYQTRLPTLPVKSGYSYNCNLNWEQLKGF